MSTRAPDAVTAETIWPKYSSLAARDVPRLAKFLFDPRSLGTLAKVTALIAIYFVLLYTPIPTLTPAPAATTESWWFLAFLDRLLTGGAFSRGSLACAGTIATLGAGEYVVGRRIAQLARGTAVLVSLSGLFTAAFAARGWTSWNLRPLILTFLCILAGGAALRFINKRLVRSRGPDLLHINIFLLLVIQLRSAVLELLRQQRYWEIALITAGSVFIAVSGYWLFRNSTYIEVKNIRTPNEIRHATLQLTAVDEVTLDFLGVFSMILYIAIAGFVSFAFGWKSVTAHNYAVFLGISIGVLFVVWGMVAVVKRAPESLYVQVLGSRNFFGLHHPGGYATRMLNYFWIIPNVRVGADTENFIENRTQGALRTTLLLSALWIGVMIVIEWYVSRQGPGVLIFPHGPLVFLFLLLMLVGNMSMIFRHVRSRWRHFKQLLRGKVRVYAQTYPLGTPDGQKGGIGLTGEEPYFVEDKISEQVQSLMDWYRLVEQVNEPRRKTSAGRRGVIFRTVTMVCAALFAAVLISFLGGLLYVIVFPQATRQEVGNVVIPLFVPSLFAPNVVWELMRKMRRT